MFTGDIFGKLAGVGDASPINEVKRIGTADRYAINIS
jgi:hypothetical protein